MGEARPAWMTDDLDEEWIDEDEASTMGTQSISLTTPLPGYLRTPSQAQEDTEPLPAASEPVGTFLIREDIPASALLPKTPGRQPKRGVIKDFFSPLALEKMFEPPSPPPSRPTALALQSAPTVPSRLCQAYTPNDSQTDLESRGQPTAALSLNSLAPPGSSVECKFTFAVSRTNVSVPQAESTPGVYSIARPPMTDPRLRLFQLQYDTFTRDHLSAMVDSIAINTTPSGGSAEGNGTSRSIPRLALVNVQEATVSDDTPIRSIKRVKLSPPSHYYGEGDGAGATIARPMVSRVDYVGESRSLMQQIKAARDFSTISTTGGLQSPESQTNNRAEALNTQSKPSRGTGTSVLRVPDERSAVTTSSSTAVTASSNHSSLAYRHQAATLMEQIKNDIRGSKRIFSGTTDVSHPAHADEVSRIEHSWSLSEVNVNVGKKKANKFGSPRRLSSSSRSYRSPRKASRNTIIEDADRTLEHEMSNMSIEAPWQVPVTSVAPNAGLNNVPHIRVTPSAIQQSMAHPPAQIPPSYPSSSIRSGSNDDLNRMVSSSTASGTITTTSSAPSFVKHAGPVQITRIAPSDVPALPQRVGRMVYDKDLMKWVRVATRTASDAEDQRDQTTGTATDGDSEDPFKDIESLKGDDDSRDTHGSVHGGVVPEAGGDQDEMEMGRIEEVEEDVELNDQEEVNLTSFSFDGPSVAVIRIVPSDDSEGDEEVQTSDSEPDDRDGAALGGEGEDAAAVFESEDEFSPELQAGSPARPTSNSSAVAVTPVAPQCRSFSLITSMPRSALKSMSVTPVSAMKDPNRDRHRTPAQRLGHRRSVSFSDGKREGPIRGLNPKGHESDDDVGSLATSVTEHDPAQGLFIPSARSRRIAELMENLESPGFDNVSPTKASSSGRPRTEELQPFASRRPSSQMAVADCNDPTRRVSSMSQKSRLSGKANATFLTECSFGLAHDRLVQVITDIQPFEPHWDELHAVDLSRKSLDGVTRLKEFLPKLDSLILNHNQLSWLSGIPNSVRTLSVAHNLLTGVTSFSHLQNIESLDISHNDIESLTQLQCLRHLRELRADGNHITSIDGLQKLDGLTKLSLQGNQIQEADFGKFRWPRLEMLNLSGNCIRSILNLASSLAGLIALNIDNNTVDNIDPGGIMPRLRILRASGNRLKRLNVAPFPNLRTLYLDNNSLDTLVKAERLNKLENLSMRNQTSCGFYLSTRQFRDVKRLYLSGNKLKSDFIEEPCYNLVYLEVAACRLSSLPHDLARLTPNLRVLNLNYNFLHDAVSLEGLTRLKKLSMIGSRLKGTKPLIRILQCMPDVEMLDFRMNPCTLGWYLPVLVKDVPGALQPSERHGSRDGEDALARGEKGSTEYGWQELDSKFRRDLPDDAYVGRLAYRGLVMRACPRIGMLDGVLVSEKERAKADQLLQGMMGKSKIKGAKGKSGTSIGAGD
ncbi:hypothetical protein DEU56DRAFT_841154 [Suillus clintonianus]|uniref:uncharacterized protein n=1 Tax=Suillus clintonianus TaxID=1904413 RepID=UPI001B883FE0|nr:uncharacterized protein DEU56DRAFT_841154 [Suillus clintonianus]KAG2115465.1 hypothetical protein DEU56DRAFT_841154 [Suillus clintonianus]